MSYVERTITINEEQDKCIEERSLKSSKVTQKAIDEIIHREAQV